MNRADVFQEQLLCKSSGVKYRIVTRKIESESLLKLDLTTKDTEIWKQELISLYYTVIVREQLKAILVFHLLSPDTHDGYQLAGICSAVFTSFTVDNCMYKLSLLSQTK